jgi:hypothetical protein
MTVESQLREHASRIEVVPISIDEMTGRGHVVSSSRWQRPVLAAAAAVLVMVGVGVFARSSGRVSTKPSATTGAPVSTETSTTVVAASGAPVANPITKRWLPTYLPPGWEVVEETESSEEQPFTLTVERGDAALFAMANDSQPLPDEAGPRWMFADRIDVGGREAFIMNQQDRLYLQVVGNEGFGLVSKGFSEQELIETAAAITIDRTSGSVSVLPVNATATPHVARSASAVQIRLRDETGFDGGTVFISRSSDVADLQTFLGFFELSAIKVLAGGYMANGRFEGTDEAERRRIVDSLAEVEASAVPTNSDPLPARTPLGQVEVGNATVEVVGPLKHACIRVVDRTSHDPCFIGMLQDHVLRSTADGWWMVAGVVVSPAARVVVEFSDGSTVEAVTAPLSSGTSVLYGARLPDKLIVRSVIVYDAAGTQIQRLGRPPREVAA